MVRMCTTSVGHRKARYTETAQVMALSGDVKRRVLRKQLTAGALKANVVLFVHEYLLRGDAKLWPESSLSFSASPSYCGMTNLVLASCLSVS